MAIRVRVRSTVFIIPLALAIGTTGPASASTTSARPPNVLLIVADDLGWKDVGYHGSEIETPNIDRIASAGLELDRMYVQPTCSPTRAALMTGKSPLRLGVLTPISKHSPHGLPIDETLLPEFFRNAGYQTFMSGKWHLGHHEKRYLPHNRGFDHFYGHVTGGIGYWNHNHGGRHDWQRNGRTVREEGYATTLITDEALKLLRERDRAKPTFLYVAYNAPHLPNEAPEQTIAKYSGIENPLRRIHAAMVDELDRSIGRLLTALDAEGMREDTIVWFVSDNGGLNRQVNPPFILGLVDTLVSVFGRPLPTATLEFLRHNVEDGASDNTPLRGGKMTVYEGGTRVPGAIWWPGQLEGGRSQAFVSVSDMLPTLLDAAGLAGNIPADLDGQSRWRTLVDGSETDAHSDYAVTAPGGLAYYRGPWKLVIPHSLLPFGDPPPELYHIWDDPTEATDLAQTHAELVDELVAAAEAMPRGPSVHGSLLTVLRDPDRFGGPEGREKPWAEAAK
ncbi:MAG: sulfatase-like hydrolase/transferase [Deltaproteobacteria bacterium]|nr:sulfatase-like hydrolase/transferase [Deltaproteobacteria bacterium]